MRTPLEKKKGGPGEGDKGKRCRNKMREDWKGVREEIKGSSADEKRMERGDMIKRSEEEKGEQ